MYVLELMRMDGQFVPSAMGDDAKGLLTLVGPSDFARIYREGELVAESLNCRFIYTVNRAKKEEKKV